MFMYIFGDFDSIVKGIFCVFLRGYGKVFRFGELREKYRFFYLILGWGKDIVIFFVKLIRGKVFNRNVMWFYFWLLFYC